MKIIILGAGVVGVTTAYFLSKRGHDVTVIDRAPESASECSFSNGGQLSYSHGEPWATSGALVKAIKWLPRQDAPLKFRPRMDAAMWLWTVQFIAQCAPKNTAKNTETLLRLGLYSREIMNRLEELKIDFHHSQKGIIHLMDTEKDYRETIEQAEFQKQFDVPFEVLSVDECVALEPALKYRAPKMHGGMRFPLDESADIFLFTRAMEERDKRTGSGVKFIYNTSVKSIKTEGQKITAVETEKGDFEADAYVVAMGAYSPIHLKPIGIKLPIYPMKGYSISVPLPNDIPADAAPNISLTDHNNKVVFTRLGNILRAAGTAEFAGYDHSINTSRIDILKRLIHENFPECEEYIEEAGEWACLRPSTPAGPPILGKSPYNNLYLNTGHGTLGWTQSAGSARIVADIIEGEEPEIDISGMSLKT